MPKKVDRSARRREIAETYVKIVARDGMEAATTRALAHELGVAKGSVWYYFKSFDEVLSESFQLTFERTNQRIAERTQGRRGLSALAAILKEIAPLSATPEHEAFVVVSFWGRVVSNLRLARFQAAVVEEWGRELRGRLREAIEFGELEPSTPVEALAEILLVLTEGYQVEYALGTALAQRERQWQAVRCCLSPWASAAALSQAGFGSSAEDPEPGL